MALTNQPYLPLYIQDWLTNTKLKQCLLGSHGLLINVMCLMHKEETYGKLLLRQKFKQSNKPEKNFALMLAKLLPFDLHEIEVSLSELIEEKVLIIHDDILICKRMVKDAETSAARAKNGKIGGNRNKENNLHKSKNFAQAKVKANPEYESEYKNESKKVFNTKPVVSDFNGLPNQYINSSKELIFSLNKVKVEDETVISLWEVFKVQHLTGDNWYANEGKVYNHFLNVIKKEKFNGTGNSKGSTKLSPSEGREAARRNY